MNSRNNSFTVFVTKFASRHRPWANLMLTFSYYVWCTSVISDIICHLLEISTTLEVEVPQRLSDFWSIVQKDPNSIFLVVFK
ncbi:Uncharacterized protein TCM_039216 [Theobroma cacao]|uniref:Uncharacterized protein n=1 Tax=Theobroma cacao TaxID=3641 RepID=A0A061GR53_THECC|nr:Uncharacterized protein TCM_039216 [Theobroma cacao]